MCKDKVAIPDDFTSSLKRVIGHLKNLQEFVDAYLELCHKHKIYVTTDDSNQSCIQIVDDSTLFLLKNHDYAVRRSVES